MCTSKPAELSAVNCFTTANFSSAQLNLTPSLPRLIWWCQLWWGPPLKDPSCRGSTRCRDPSFQNSPICTWECSSPRKGRSTTWPRAPLPRNMSNTISPIPWHLCIWQFEPNSRINPLWSCRACRQAWCQYLNLVKTGQPHWTRRGWPIHRGRGTWQSTWPFRKQWLCSRSCCCSAYWDCQACCWAVCSWPSW